MILDRLYGFQGEAYSSVSILEGENRSAEDAVLCRGLGDPAWEAGNPQIPHPQSPSRMQNQGKEVLRVQLNRFIILHTLLCVLRN